MKINLNKNIMKESIFQLKEGFIFIRQRDLGKDMPVLFFIHGLGESGLCFREAFEAKELKDFTLIVPDLPGYGGSSEVSDSDYSMEAQVRRLWQLADGLGLKSFFLIGHSLGGDLGTLMASSDTRNRIQGLINVEGDLTPHDVFFSNRVVSAAEGGNFIKWFETDFKEGIVLNGWGREWASCRRYYASLQFASPEAFIANAKEIYQNNKPLPGTNAALSGLTYSGLKIPKVFCWGNESLSKGTLDFLESSSLEQRKFEPSFHWVMIDQSEEFYRFVSEFVA